MRLNAFLVFILPSTRNAIYRLLVLPGGIAWHLSNSPMIAKISLAT
jgi:hypothetical protein